MFKIGEKVVCVNDESGWITRSSLLKKGEIYEVLNTNIADNGRSEILINCGDLFWDASRFRKLDYSFAENLLEKIREDVSKDNLVEAYS